MLGIDTRTGELVSLHPDGAWTSLTDLITTVPEEYVHAAEPGTPEGRIILRILERLGLTEDMLEGYTPSLTEQVPGEATIYEIGKITAFTALRDILQEEYKRIEGT